MCGSGRSRPNITRTTDLTITISAGTITTTTPRRRCFHCGTPATQPCVTTCEPAGKTWADFCLNDQKGKKVPNITEDMQTSRNIKEHPVFSSTDVISSTHMLLPAHMAPLLRFLLSPAVTTTSLSYPETQNPHTSLVHHLSTSDLLTPPVEVRAQAWSRSQQ